MLDAVNFEDCGKPAAVVATTNFVRLATSIATANHLDDVAAGDDTASAGQLLAEAAERAKAVAPQVVAAITSDHDLNRSGAQHGGAGADQRA